MNTYQKPNAGWEPLDSLLTENSCFDREQLLKTPARIKTGYTRMDQLLGGGLAPGLVILGGSPSLGKSTFALSLARNVAASGTPVLYYSYEMPKKWLLAKLITCENFQRKGTPFTADNLFNADIMQDWSDELWTDYRAACESISEKIRNLIVVDPMPGGEIFSAQKLTDNVREYISEHHQKPLVVVDYLQILPSEINFAGNARLQVEDSLKKLVVLSKKENLTVLLISSLSRSNYKTPMQIDSFKETGSIEYSADVLLGIQFSACHDAEGNPARERDWNLNAEKEKVPREVELVFLKQRYGTTGTVTLDYYAQYDCMEEVTRTAPQNDTQKRHAEEAPDRSAEPDTPETDSGIPDESDGTVLQADESECDVLMDNDESESRTSDAVPDTQQVNSAWIDESDLPPDSDENDPFTHVTDEEELSPELEEYTMEQLAEILEPEYYSLFFEPVEEDGEEAAQSGKRRFSTDKCCMGNTMIAHDLRQGHSVPGVPGRCPVLPKLGISTVYTVDLVPDISDCNIADALYSLFLTYRYCSPDSAFTLRHLLTALTGDGSQTLTAQKKGMLLKSLHHLEQIRISIDCKEEQKARSRGRRYRDFHFEEPHPFLTLKEKKGRYYFPSSDMAEVLPLYAYGEITGQVITFPPQLLNATDDSGHKVLSDTSESIALKRFLIFRLEILRNRKGSMVSNGGLRVISAAANSELFRELGLHRKNFTSDARWKQHCQRLERNVAAVLDYFKRIGYIRDYEKSMKHSYKINGAVADPWSLEF